MVQYNVSEEERNRVANNIQLMINIKNNESIKEEYVTKLFREWKQVAKRLNKGKSIINQMGNNLEDEAMNDKQKKLLDLYSFLHSLLGLYDMFFNQMLSQEHHHELQSYILDDLRT